MQITNIKTFERITKKKGVEVLRGKPEGSSDSIILKRSVDPGSHHIISHLSREFQLSTEKQLLGFLTPIETDGRVFIYKDPGGISLKQMLAEKIPSIRFSLNVMISLSRCLKNLHQADMVYKQLNPDTILIAANSHTTELFFTNIEQSQFFPKGKATEISADSTKEAMSYFSPEQTGRMDRLIDYRSDFYSLGVLLYRFLTGNLPFSEKSSMDLLHSILAITPPPPEIFNPKLPAPVSDITMKLLAKEPDERYQSNEGLLEDLRTCRDKLLQTGRIQPFKIGKDDVHHRLVLSNKPFGREKEIAALQEAIKRHRKSNNELILIKGSFGCGKTTIVNSIKNFQIEKGSLCYWVKCNHERQKEPLALFKELVKLWIKTQLKQSQSYQIRVRTRIEEELKDHLPYLIQIFPSLSLLMEKQPSTFTTGVPINPDISQAAISNLLKASRYPEQNAIVLIDNGQWADDLSIQLITNHIKTNPSGSLLGIMAVREDKPEFSPHIRVLMETALASNFKASILDIKPLAYDDMVNCFAHWFTCTSDRVAPMAELCINSTDGTFFSIRQCIKSLYENGHIYFDTVKKQWDWKIKEIHHLLSNKRSINWVSQAINTLPVDSIELLKMASCIGSAFDAAILSALSGYDEQTILNVLETPRRVGLIVPFQHDYKEFEFIHTQIKERLYQHIEEDIKRQYHLGIARELFKHSNKQYEKNLFRLINHFNLAQALISDTREQHQVAKLNLEAAKNAIEKTAHSQALEYAQIGINLLKTEGWETKYQLTIELHLIKLHCSALLEQNLVYQKAIGDIKTNAKRKIDLADMYLIIANKHLADYRFDKAIEASVAALDYLGIQFPYKPICSDTISELHSLEHEINQTNGDIPSNLLKEIDPHTARILSLSRNVGFSGLAFHTEFYILYLINSVRLSLQKGVYVTTPILLMLCGRVTILASGKINSGSAFFKLAEKLKEKLKPRQIISKIYHVMSLVFNDYTSSFHALSVKLNQNHAYFMNAGLYDFGIFSGLTARFIDFTRGEPLYSIADTIENQIEEMDTRKNRLGLPGFSTLFQVISHLRDKKEVLSTFDETVTDKSTYIIESNTSHRARFNPIKQAAAFILGNYDAALIEDEKLEYWVYEFIHLSWPEIVDALFYDSMARLALWSSWSKNQKAVQQKNIEHCNSFLKQMAEANPTQYNHKLYLIQAEQKKIEGDLASAMDFYDSAIASADKYGFLHITALANELAAAFWFSMNKPSFAVGYLKSAQQLYEQWGAKRKVRELFQTYPNILNAPPKKKVPDTFTPDLINSDTIDVIDFSAVISSAQAISKELSLNRLVERMLSIVISNAGAVRGVLLLEKDGRLEISAEARREAEKISFENYSSVSKPPVEKCLLWPAVCLAFQSGNAIVLRDAKTDARFSLDPYLENKKKFSVLCMPVINQADCFGVLYLENNLAAGSFNSDRIEVLKLLISQIAISLINARFVEKIQNETATRRVAEQKLAQEKERLSITLGSIGEGVIATDINGKIILMNQMAQHLTGWKESEAIDQPLDTIYQVIDSTSRQKLENPFKMVLSTRKTAQFARQASLIKKDKTERIISDVSAPIRDLSSRIEGVVLVFQDITQQVKMEKQLFESQKMEAIGTLSGGIAHDFNNILGGIIGCIQMAGDSLPENAREQKWLSMASTACNRAKSVIRQLLDFYRPDKNIAHRFSIITLIKEIQKLLKAFIPPNIQITFKFHKKDCWINADPNKIHQSIMNLCTNAYHAMQENGGVMKIIVDEPKRVPPELETNLAHEFVRIKIKDTGCGMDDKTMSRIFEPYFTTKGKGEGSGMGLAVVHGIIKGAKGAITVKSRPDIGSSFSVFLPLAVPMKEDQEQVDPVAGGTEQILFVDDEEVIIAANCEALSRLGYQVKGTRNPEEALGWVKNEPNRFDILVTDLSMPKLNGNQLAVEIRKIRPKIPIIICSGFFENEEQKELDKLNAHALLNKPYGPQELGDIIRSVLNQTS